MLCEIIEKVGVELEQDYAQMKLMDSENEQLCQKAFSKDQQKAARKKLTSGQAHHMTAPKIVDLLVQQTLESIMGDLFKEASEQFKMRQETIDDHHKQVTANKKVEEKAWKVEGCHAKILELEAKKARIWAE